MFSSLSRFLIAASTFVISSSSLALYAQELTVYSARKTQLIEHVFAAYTAESGVKINFTTDKAGPLLQKLLSEGKRTKADILLTVDAGNLWAAAERGILKSIDSDILENNIPDFYRDSANRWFGLSVRSRTMVYNPKKIIPSELSTYEDLAQSKWKGRLALRTSKKVYNQSLVAMMIEEHGKEKTLEIVKGWVSNLAAPVFAKDSKALNAVASGQADVTLVNTYYFGRLMKENPNLPLKIFWPNQNKGGVHVNVSGAGVIRHSKNTAAAIKFIEWLSSENAQNLFADVNMEYPVNPTVEASKLVQSWGSFTPHKTNLAVAGRRQREAIMLMDMAGYK
jgi:iron(III) transport system substrate-binding protein